MIRTVLGRFLCLLGFHRWLVLRDSLMNAPATWWAVSTTCRVQDRVCARCDREDLMLQRLELEVDRAKRMRNHLKDVDP